MNNTGTTDAKIAPVVIDDTVKEFDPQKHIYPPEYEGHFATLMVEAATIRHRIRELAGVLHTAYRGQRPILLCTLKGACPFYAHLMDELQDLRQGYDMEFVRASSYDGTSTTGNVQLSAGLKPGALRGRHVLIIEDILDTGTTLSHLIPVLRKDSPASLEVVTLLDKRLDEPKKYVAKYVGFSIPNHFIVGYGLDYNELYRDLKDIFVISQSGIDFDASKLHSLR